MEVNDNPGSFCAVDLREGGEGREKKRREGGKRGRRQVGMEGGRVGREEGREGATEEKGTVRIHEKEGKRRMDTMSPNNSIPSYI